MSHSRRGSTSGARSKAAQQAAAVDERRKHERKQSDVDVDLLVMGPDHTPVAETHGFARNISKGGMGLITAGPIAKDADLLMVFRRTRQGAPPVLYGKVCNCVQQESGWYSIGVQFRGMPAALADPQWMHQAATKLFRAA